MSNVDLTVKEADAPGTLTNLKFLGLDRQIAAQSKSFALAEDDHQNLEDLLAAVQGLAHGASAATLNPALIGIYGAALGANPADVAAGQLSRIYGMRNGIPFSLGGHPNILTREWVIADADGAQSNAQLLSVGGGTRIVITQAQCAMSGSNTGETAIRLGFSPTTLAAPSPTTGIGGIILSGKFSKNGGISRGTGAAIIAIGGDGDDMLLTCDDPAGGDLRIVVSYFTCTG